MDDLFTDSRVSALCPRPVEIWSRGVANFQLKRSEKCVHGSKTGLWRDEGCGSGVEHLSSIYQAVGLIPSITIEQETKQFRKASAGLASCQRQVSTGSSVLSLVTWKTACLLYAALLKDKTSMTYRTLSLTYEILCLACYGENNLIFY